MEIKGKKYDEMKNKKLIKKKTKRSQKYSR
jgi:hypothetical protein